MVKGGKGRDGKEGKEGKSKGIYKARQQDKKKRVDEDFRYESED